MFSLYQSVKNYINSNRYVTVLEEVIVKEIRKYKRIKDNISEDELLQKPHLRNYKVFNHHNNLSNIKSIDLRDNFPEVYDQGQLGSCTANAICAAYEYEMKKQEGNYKPMSRLFLYYLERDMEGTVNEDSGAQIKDGIFATEKTGLCLEELYPYNIDNFTVKPEETCYINANNHKTVEACRIEQNVDDIKQCLLDGYPIVFGITVYESFESEEVAKTATVPLPQKNEKVLGGHAIVIVGYKQINNSNYFIIRNSWGTGWGDGGYCYIPEAYILDSELSEDFWSIKLVDDKPDSSDNDNPEL